MQLSPAGVMIESWWHSLPNRFPDIDIGAVVIMPNHLQGLVMIGIDPDRHHVLPSLSDVIGWFKSYTTNDYMLGVRTETWPRFPGKLWQQGF